MNVIENNKIIAEFMGAKYSEDYDKDNLWLPNHGICNYATTEIGNGKTLRYHCDWNWLMEAVENIERMNYTTSIYHLPKTLNTVKIISGGVDVIGVNRETKIEAVYLAVVEFIKSQN